jgi:hypothetical protein
MELQSVAELICRRPVAVEITFVLQLVLRE